MYEWSLVTQCCAVSEISYVNGVMRKERIIIIIIIINNNNKDSTEIGNTIKDSDKIGIF